MKIYRIVSIIAMLALMLMLVSCGNSSIANDDRGDDRGDNGTHDVENALFPAKDEESGLTADNVTSYIIGNFQYPENPAKQLRIALENDVNERELPLMVSDAERIVFNNREYTQIKVTFLESDNIGVILFLNRHLDFDVLLDEGKNPSFTIAFKDHDNYQDMVMILTSVIMYLSPDLNLEEAESLATLQDRTISVDGYSMPLDISGYQIQTRHTNPHVFIQTPYFDARLGVRVRAIEQLWQGALDIGYFYELSGPQDYYLLNISFWDESRHPEGVYADFIVKNTWQYQCWMHGRTSVIVDVESMSGRQFSFGIDTWTRFYDPYEFGVGQIYTIFIGLRFNQGILHAVQRTKATEFNSRGQAQSVDMLTLEFIDSVRTWPDGDGTVLEVHFQTYAFGPLCIFFVLEGYGLGGETVWPQEQYYPIREDYTFLGWFNNPYFIGEPYTNETPIYHETNLFAKWKYSGSGGVWPRAYRGIIQGIDERDALYLGQNLTITAIGHNMSLESPQDKRFRWMPISWRLSDGTSGVFTCGVPFQSNIHLINIGEQWLYITYLEEVFDRVDWQETGQIHEVRERLLVVNPS